jgi:hypothetical protein
MTHLSDRRVPSNSKILRPADFACCMVWICCAITLSTSKSMRLNSSKHAQAPLLARPLKNLPYSSNNHVNHSFMFHGRCSRFMRPVCVCLTVASSAGGNKPLTNVLDVQSTVDKKDF